MVADNGRERPLLSAMFLPLNATVTPDDYAPPVHALSLTPTNRAPPCRHRGRHFLVQYDEQLAQLNLVDEELRPSLEEEFEKFSNLKALFSLANEVSFRPHLAVVFVLFPRTPCRGYPRFFRDEKKDSCIMSST